MIVDLNKSMKFNSIKQLLENICLNQPKPDKDFYEIKPVQINKQVGPFIVVSVQLFSLIGSTTWDWEKCIIDKVSDYDNRTN